MSQCRSKIVEVEVRDGGTGRMATSSIPVTFFAVDFSGESVGRTITTWTVPDIAFKGQYMNDALSVEPKTRLGR